MGELKDRRDNELSEKAWAAGQKFAKAHPFSEYAEDRNSRRLMYNCPPYLQRFADVFKYGCQDIWRQNGELPTEDNDDDGIPF